MVYAIIALGCALVGAWITYNADAYDWNHYTRWLALAFFLFLAGFGFLSVSGLIF